MAALSRARLKVIHPSRVEAVRDGLKLYDAVLARKLHPDLLIFGVFTARIFKIL